MIQIRAFHCLLIFLISLLPYAAQKATLSSPHNTILYTRTPTGISLFLYTSEYQVSDVGFNSVLEVRNAEFLYIDGQPAQPVFSALVAIPVDAHLESSISSFSTQIVTAPHNLAIYSPHSNSDENPLVLSIDTDAKSCTGDTPASIEVGEPAWIRNQRVVRVTFSPFRWNCAQRAWLYHPQLELQLQFDHGTPGPSKSSAHLASPEFESVLASSLINYQDGQAWRGMPAENDASPMNPAIAKDASAPSQKVKITLLSQGIYQIGFDDLQAIEMDMAALNPQNLLLENQGRPVAFHFSGDDDQAFEQGEAIQFYAEKFSGDYLASLHPDQDDDWMIFHNGFTPQFNGEMIEKYNDNNVYWLSSQETSSEFIQMQAQGVESYPVVDRSIHPALFEQDRRWWTLHFTSEETWFWEHNISVSSAVVERTFPFSIQDALLDPLLSADLELQLTSNSASSANPDHRIEILLNDQFLSQESWDGAVWHTISLAVNQDLLVNGENSLKIRFIPIVGVIANRYAFDQFELHFTRALQARDGRIEFSQPAGDWTFQISGFGDDPVRIWDVSNPRAPLELTEFTQAEGLVTFSNSSSTTKNYIVFDDSAQSIPAMEKVHLGGLSASSNAANYLIITIPEFEEALLPLIDYRTQQGKQVQVVELEHIYNEFNFGIPHPIAIKNFLQFASQHWEVVPTYVVLVGDGHWDLKNYQVPAPNPIPPNFVWADPVQGEIDSLSDLAAVVGDDLLPDFLISRMAVNNPEELNAIITKTIQFEENQGDWLNKLAFVADNYYLTNGCVDNDPATPCSTDPAGNFPAMMDAFIEEFIGAPYTAFKFYLDDYHCRSGQPDNCNLVTDALVNDINITPAQIYTYAGHGAISGWAGEKIFNTEDLPRLTNTANFPVFFSLDCVDGFYYYPPGIATPDPIALAELITRQPGTGAAAMYAATGFSYSSAHDVLQRGFFEYFFRTHNPVLGAADLSAKLKVYATGANDEMIFTYMIFVDAALRMHNELQFIYLPLLGR